MKKGTVELSLSASLKGLTCRFSADHFRLRKWLFLTGPGISDHAVSESAAPRRSPSSQIPEV